MHKHIAKHYISYLIYPIFLGIMLCSCSNDTVESTASTGTLCVDLALQQPGNIAVNTRAVSQGLQVDVIDGTRGDVYHFSEEEATAGLRSLELKTGTYTLKAYSANYNTTYADSELGDEKWFAETVFNIQSEQQTRVGLNVPMTNFGIRFQTPQGIGEWFTSQEFSVTYAGRTLTIPTNGIAYFDVVEGQELSFHLALENTDGERFQSQSALQSNEVNTGTLYTVTYEMVNQAPQLIMR